MVGKWLYFSIYRGAIDEADFPVLGDTVPQTWTQYYKFITTWDTYQFMQVQVTIEGDNNMNRVENNCQSFFAG